MKPRISICIPTFNRSDLLDQCLQSVANQTVKSFEVIISDNASTDDTQDILKRYKEKYGFKYITQRANLGMIGNWNAVLKEARGTHLTLLHSDDMLAPNWCRKWSTIIEKNNAQFYTSSFMVVNEFNIPQYRCHIFNEDTLVRQPKVLNELLKNGAPMIAPTGASIFKKDVLDKFGKFDPKYATEADVQFWLNVVSTCDIYYCNELLFAYRVHPHQTSDKEIVKKSTAAELKRFENYVDQINVFYRKNLKSKNRLFMQSHLFMSLAAINLYMVKLRFDKVFGSQKIALKYFPELYRSLSDWRFYLPLQIRFINRALLGRRISDTERQQMKWLKKIRMTGVGY